LVERRRHSSVKTVDYTATDWILHLGPGVLAALTVLGLAAFDYYVMSNMREWMTGGLLDSGEKDKITEQTIFYIPPYCFNLWIGVFTVYIMYLSGKFAYRRLYLDWRPPEKVIIDKGD
jgi:hypothetical protein